MWNGNAPATTSRPGGLDNRRFQRHPDWRSDRRGGGFRDPSWWRERRGFGAYDGRRAGYWFAPGWGYYRPDPRWYGFDWEVGVAVPFELRGYVLNDPYEYGLPPAPYGCEWIFLGNELVLISLESGQILQVGYSF